MLKAVQSPVPHSSTPLAIIAHVSRIVTRTVDRITGDRVEYPLLVAAACVATLKLFQIESRVMYGQVGWVEILDDHTPLWAGCWGDNYHFWVATQYGEIVDLNTSVAYRKLSHSNPQFKPLYSPPMLWSTEVPGFYRYVPEGVAEIELTDEKDQKRYQTVLDQIQEICNTNLVQSTLENIANNDTESLNALEFPNEPILCPGRKLLDDSKETFRHFDRILGVNGIPPAPDAFSSH